MKFLIFVLLFFSLTNNAEVLKYDITGYKRTLHTYKDVCEKFGHKELLIIDVTNPIELDCMGYKVSIKDFCQKDELPPNGVSLLRGYVNQRMSEVVCEYGKSAFLSLSCDKKTGHYCKTAETGCSRLNDIYAYNHQLFEASVVEKKGQKVLSCLYERGEAKNTAEVTTKILLPFQEEEVIDKDIFAFDKVRKFSE